MQRIQELVPGSGGGFTGDQRVASSAIGRVDFHLHSYASNVTDYYAANALSIPESYSAPLDLYRVLKRRGMSLVTITDHNSIDGVLELLNAGLKDVFISAEMTTTFPEDGCNIHITVANMTDLQFREIDRLRGNVYEMVAYVDQQIATEIDDLTTNRLTYFMTHPLMSTQNRPYGRDGALTVGHIERALLLCHCIEVHNGARTRALNDLTARMIATLDAAAIMRLADKHDLAPKGPTPWLKAVVGGSDDHSGINPGRTWTEFALDNATPSAANPANTLVDAIRARATRPVGAHGGPITIAHSVMKLFYDGGTRRAGGAQAKTATFAGPLHALFRLVFDGESRGWLERLRFQARVLYVRHQSGGELRRLLGPRTANLSFEAVLEREIYALLADPRFVSQLDNNMATDERIFLVVKTLVNRIFANYLKRLRNAGTLSLVGVVKEAVALFSSNIFVSLPYLVAFVQQGADGRIAHDVRKVFDLTDRQKIVLVTDTFFEVNGVAASIKRMIREAIRRGIDFTVVTCVSAADMDRRANDPEALAMIAAGRLKLFTSIESVGFPQYDGLQIHFPPVLDLLHYIQESGFTKIHISTPGTLGLFALAAAKVLQIECAATYHTSIPEYVENYTKDLTLEAVAWKYMIMFYHAMDEVLVPSKFIANLLHDRGLRNRKILILDRWVDIERFHPAKRIAGFWNQFGIEYESELVKFIYVGRIAVEKNLQTLAVAYRGLCATRSDARLIIVGDGPYRAELERQLAGLAVTFTGYLSGEALAQAYASADVKVFPSTTDTWGNAPLEAQASGLPVVVSNIGGPAELMIDGVTGFMVPGHQAQPLREAMLALMDRTLREQMGRDARAFSEANRVDEPFSAVLESERYRQKLRLVKRAARPNVASRSSLDLEPRVGSLRVDDGALA